MALSVKLQKEKEIEIHEQLFNNILVLSMEYPTSKEFNIHFKKDMFLKSNKAAFQHVTHFLLNILDPVSFSQKVCWPILDNKMETQYRNEVMKYINELIVLYEDTGIPVLMTSHVISPGGYRFAEFIFKLSQFILLEHLQRDQTSDTVCLRPKADIDSNIASEQLKNLNNMVEDQYITLALKQVEFHSKYNNIKQNVTDMTEQKSVVKKTLLDTKYQIRELQEKYKCEFNNEELLSFDERILRISQQLETLRVNENKYKHYAELVNILSLNRNILRYENQLLSPSENPKEKENLIDILKSYLELLKNKRNVAQNTNYVNSANHLDVVTQVFNDLNDCYEKYELLNSELLFYSSELEEIISNYNNYYYEDNSLLHKINKIFEPLQSIKIDTDYLN